MFGPPHRKARAPARKGRSRKGGVESRHMSCPSGPALHPCNSTHTAARVCSAACGQPRCSRWWPCASAVPQVRGQASRPSQLAGTVGTNCTGWRAAPERRPGGPQPPRPPPPHLHRPAEAQRRLAGAGGAPRRGCRGGLRPAAGGAAAPSAAGRRPGGRSCANRWPGAGRWVGGGISARGAQPAVWSLLWLLHNEEAAVAAMAPRTVSRVGARARRLDRMLRQHVLPVGGHRHCTPTNGFQLQR